MKQKLTNRQKQVLNAISEAIREYGRPPSIPELMEKLGVASPNGIAKHLNALEAKGVIARQRGARGISVLQQKSEADSEIAINNDKQSVAYLPLIGTIAAGSPILAQENIDEIIPVPKSMNDEATDTFFLRVKGDSMIEEGILPGDLVMVARCDQVENGEIAAVMVEDEATVKRFYRRGGKIILEPANSAYEPIVIEAGSSECRIIGRIIGLMRSYKRKF